MNGRVVAPIRRNMNRMVNSLSFPPRHVVIGTGRCGTGYFTRVLKEHGYDTGHEAYYNSGLQVPKDIKKFECSWLAVPDLIRQRHTDLILHITRHPFDVVASLEGIGFFAVGEMNPFTDFAREACPQIRDLCGIEASAVWWREYNQQCRFIAADTIKIEDFAVLPSVQKRAGDALGVVFDPAIIDTIPTNVNSRERAELSAEDKKQITEIIGHDVLELFGYLG